MMVIHKMLNVAGWCCKSIIWCFQITPFTMNNVPHNIMIHKISQIYLIENKDIRWGVILGKWWCVAWCRAKFVESKPTIFLLWNSTWYPFTDEAENIFKSQWYFSAIGAQYNTVFYRLCEIILATGKWYKHVDHRDVYLAPGSKNIDNSTIQKIAK